MSNTESKTEELVITSEKAYVSFKKLHPDAIIPSRATPVSAGFDLYCLEDTLIDPKYGSVRVKTGIAAQMVGSCYGRIAMRSGLAVREHLAVSGGVIDLDYTGPIDVIVFCTRMFTERERGYGHHGYTIKKGERFAQLLIEFVSYAPAKEVTEFEHDYGKHDGFGSTGK